MTHSIISELLENKSFILIISIIWGLGLASMLRSTCHNKQCKMVLYKGEDPNILEKKIFNYGTNKCYSYTPIITKCYT